MNHKQIGTARLIGCVYRVWVQEKNIHTIFTIRLEHIPAQPVLVQEYCFNYIRTWSATRKYMDALGTGFLHEAKEHVSKIWGLQNVKKLIKTTLTVVSGYH